VKKTAVQARALGIQRSTRPCSKPNVSWLTLSMVMIVQCWPDFLAMADLTQATIFD